MHKAVVSWDLIRQWPGVYRSPLVL